MNDSWLWDRSESKRSATQIYYNKKGKKAKKSGKRKKKGNLLYRLKEGRTRTNPPPPHPLPTLLFSLEGKPISKVKK
jgi:hypothetical protein